MAERILVTGGTGKTGRLVADGLRRRGSGVRVATRSPKGPGQVRFDWSDPDSFGPALDRVDAVYLVAPTDRSDHLAAMRPFLERAVADGVVRFVLLSASSLDEGGPMMGEVQAWLRAHARRWMSLRPSWFMQNFTTQHLRGIVEEGAVYSATGDGRVAFIDVADIAAVAVEALTDPAFPTGELILTGPEAIGYDNVARRIGAVAGRDVRHERLGVEALAARYRAAGLPPDYAATLAAMDGVIAAGAEDRVTDAVRDATGRGPVSFNSFARENAVAFRDVGLPPS